MALRANVPAKNLDSTLTDIWDGTSKSKQTADESKNWHIYTPEEMKYFEEFVNGKLTDEEKEGLEITDSTIIYLENDIDMGARQENGVLTAGRKQSYSKRNICKKRWKFCRIIWKLRHNSKFNDSR